MTHRGERTVSLCCADWPALATGRPSHVPVAVVHANRIISVSPAARHEGVSVGLRRREAQARCPSLEIHDADEARDARAFEAVLGALDGIAPRWEVSEPGRVAVPAVGPSRYHGGDRQLAAKVLKVVRESLNTVLEVPDPTLGVAVVDGPRAAAVMAERATVGSAGDGGVCVVPPGETSTALDGLPVATLASGGPGWGDPPVLGELIDVLRRLGLRTLGRYAAIEPTDVLARFGVIGSMTHDFARGREAGHVALAELPVDLRVSAAVDPPAELVDRAAFVAKVLADDLHSELAKRGLACTRVLVVAETEVGDRIERLWRHEGALSASALAQRARWQLDGWISTGRGLGRCRGGISRIELVPDQVVPDDGLQLGFWGGSSEVGERALKALARVQAMLGPEAVVVPEWRGGRSPGERYRPVPLETVDLDARVGRDERPWPGALPAPSPAAVWSEPASVEVLDGQGVPVGVNGRGVVSGAPAQCGIGGGPRADVKAWAGPWCIDERWWDPTGHRRRARLQVILEPGATAHLLTLESGQWWLEATYD
ncbi:MAG: DNA polymerase Y family protein [Microthrixaceae bacterium]